MAETRRQIKSKPSTAERQLAAKIRAESSKHSADPEAFDKAKRYAEATVANERFETHNRTPDGFTIHRFWRQGEQLTGMLGQCNGQNGYGESTYPIVLDDGSVVCVPGNRRLVKAFRTSKAFFHRITITYLGKLNQSHSHYEKVYSVELSPLDKEGVGKVGREILAKAVAEAKRVLKLAKTE